MQRARVLQQELAHLIAFAHHDPKNIPDLTKPRDPPKPADLRDALTGFFGAMDRTPIRKPR